MTSLVGVVFILGVLVYGDLVAFSGLEGLINCYNLNFQFWFEV